MLKQILLSVFLAVVIQHLLKVMYTFGFHKSVLYHHAPGPCRQIIKENGSEDLTVLPNGLALLSTGLYEKVGQIKLVDLDDPELKVKDVVIEGGDGIDQFMVKSHGLSAFTDDKTGAVTVAVITHPELCDDRVEFFTFDQEKAVLKHTHSVTQPSLYNLNDLVLVSPNQFYTTKTHRLRRDWRLLETFLLLKWGELLFYDGSTVWTVDTGLSFPNGINVSPSQSHLYLAEFVSSTVSVYKRHQDNSVTRQQSVYVGSHVDNIDVDRGTGDLWIGSHYVLHDIADFLSAYEKNRTEAAGMISSSQVFKLKTRDDLIHVTDVIEVYLNNGTELTGSSIAAVYGSKMIVGSIASQTIVCELIYAD